MNSFFRRFAIILIGILALAQLSASATPTENNGLRILPAPGRVVIDGKTDDWDLSGGIFACDNVEEQRDQYATWLHAMYDKDNLYILARFNDLTPLNNPGQTTADFGFAGDCLQFRIIGAPDTPNERTSHWTCWRGKDGSDIMTEQFGKTIDDKLSIHDAKTQGAQQAFAINADGKGYVQEIAIPWKLLTRDGTAPAPGESIRPDVRAEFHGWAEEPRFAEGLVRAEHPARPRLYVHGVECVGHGHAASRAWACHAAAGAARGWATIRGADGERRPGRRLDRLGQIE